MPRALLHDAKGRASLLVLAPGAYTLFEAFQTPEIAGAYLQHVIILHDIVSCGARLSGH